VAIVECTGALALGAEEVGWTVDAAVADGVGVSTTSAVR